MEIFPILRALRRSKVGAILMGLQIALTLAIVCNSLSIIQQQLRQMRRPTGIDEANIFTMASQWVVDPANPEASIQGDMAALRALPGVIDAEPTNSFPLAGGGRMSDLNLRPQQPHPSARTAEYFVDEHGLAVYGLNLTAGRWFAADDVVTVHPRETQYPAAIVITRHLAQELFASGPALGQLIYISPTIPSRVVGIVERAQTPFGGLSWGNWGEAFLENSIFEPIHEAANGTNYVVRTKPGQLAAMMGAAPAALNKLTRQRYLNLPMTFADTRRHVYKRQHSAAVLLSAVSAALMGITASGIVGLTLYWVTQRRRYIGLRRALGARRLDILKYYHTENLLIAGAGSVLGVALGLAANTWLTARLEITRMSVAYACIGGLIVLALCQLAVLWPALRAASVPPAIASRGM